MNKRRNLALVLATLLCIPVLSVVPVAAEDGGSSGGSGSGDTSATTTGDGGTGTNTGTNSGGASNSGSGGQNSTETETTAETTEVHNRITELKQEAKDALQTLRETHKEKSQAQRQQACEAHQTEINNRVNNYAAAARRHMDVFTGILTKVEDFYTNKKLNVASYNSLLATAEAKQATAQQAVDVLKGLDVSIDCTQPDPAQAMQTVKTAVANARTALQAYRSAIKDVVVAITGASSATDTSSTGGNQ